MVGSVRNSTIWDHFIEYHDSAFKGRRVRCNHCGKTYGVNATTQKEHLVLCRKYVEYMQSTDQTSVVYEKALRVQARGEPLHDELTRQSGIYSTRIRTLSSRGRFNLDSVNISFTP